MISGETNESADRKSPGRGRPAKRETAVGVRDMQSVLSYLRTRGQAISGVSGKPLDLRAMAYVIWFEQDRRAQQQEQARARRRGRWAPPQGASWMPPAIGVDLERAREEATKDVRRKLLDRARKHVERARRGETVYALRMTDPGSGGPRYVPAVGDAWPGVPGLYSYDWPTTIGLKGEASLELAEAAVRRGGFELVKLDLSEAETIRERLRKSQPDDAAVAEEVASRCWPGSAERALRRLIREAQTYEYVHLGNRGARTKRRLPPTRS